MRINNHYAETMMNVLMNFSQSSPMALRHPFAAQHIRTIELNTSRSFLYALLVTSGITFCTILILQQQSFSAIPVPNIIHVVGIIPKQDAKKNAGHESAQQKPIQQLRQSGGTPPSQSMNDATPVAKNTQDEQHHDSLQSSTGTSIATNSGQQGGAFSQGNDTDDKKTSGTGIQDNGGNQNEDDIEFNSNIEEYPIVNLDALQRSIIYPEMARQLRIEGIVYVS
ncbi:MAG: hypothetical protein JNL32_11970, partial [Candidatus Kapabacteria bacterium]|nr:hypothetical protein [Candidatus Kapabacteria bacterium]